jgi:hypothetical protein
MCNALEYDGSRWGISKISFELYHNLPSNVSFLADFLPTQNFYWGVFSSLLGTSFSP